MTTHADRLKAIARKVIEAAAPEPVSIEAIYESIASKVEFDADDLRPPPLRGKPTTDLTWKKNARTALQGERERFRLVRKRPEQWSLPTPLPEDEQLDVEAGWRIVRLAALREAAAEQVWHSPRQQHRYQVQEVGPNALLVRRVDSSAPAQLTQAVVERSLGYLNAAGGVVGRRTLHNTVAIESAVVHLHPRIEWSDEYDSIRVSGAQSQESDLNDDATAADVALQATGEEGARKLVTHWQRERNSALVRKLKDKYVSSNDGDAPCEVCGFDMRARYPGLAAPYIEAHHREPLSGLNDDGPRELTYENLAFLCANCHRAIHRPFDGAFLSVEQLKRRVQRSQGGQGDGQDV